MITLCLCFIADPEQNKSAMTLHFRPRYYECTRSPSRHRDAEENIKISQNPLITYLVWSYPVHNTRVLDVPRRHKSRVTQSEVKGGIFTCRLRPSV